MTIYFAPEAEGDFTEVVSYLADRNPTAAGELGRRIFAVIDQLATGAFEGVEQVLTAGEVVRSWAVPPVRIYYQRVDDALWILRIYHQARPSIVR